MQPKKAILLFLVLLIATSIVMIKAIPFEQGTSVKKPGERKACKSTACSKGNKSTETDNTISPWNFLSNRVLNLKS